jgi:2-hydroxy-3-oxopropionate reductase
LRAEFDICHPAFEKVFPLPVIRLILPFLSRLAWHCAPPIVGVRKETVRMAKITPKIAFLGAGLMGAPMARRLLAAGHNVSVWNRSPEKAKALETFGAKAFDAAEEAAAGADIIIAMLFDGAAVEDALFAQGAAARARPGAAFIDMSSISPATARDHEKRLLALGFDYLDAPVSGGTAGAEAGTLAIMAGGKAETFQRAADIFKPLGSATHVGPAGSGQLAKLCNQAIVAITIGAVAEALFLAEKGGADPAAVREALKGGFADSRILELHGKRMLDGNYAPGGRSSFQLKDLNNIASVADGLGLDLPLAALMRERFQRLVEEMGGADLDHAALFLELKARNGG